MTTGVFSFVLCLQHGHKQLIISDYPPLFQTCCWWLCRNCRRSFLPARSRELATERRLQLRVSDIRRSPLLPVWNEKRKAALYISKRQKRSRGWRSVLTREEGEDGVTPLHRGRRIKEGSENNAQGAQGIWQHTHGLEYQVTAPPGLRASTERRWRRPGSSSATFPLTGACQLIH